MVQISILSGIYADNGPDLRTSYPVNMVPVPKDNGISGGFLRPADGLVSNGTGPGVDRGGINWNNVCYRVMGSKFCSVSSTGVVTVIGDVGDDGKDVSMDYSFDLLAIASNENLFYYDGSTVTQVTDPDLGVVLDVVWVDGYFMTTDGQYLVVTDLSDPYSVNPLKYGSSEADPDPVVALLKLRNEVYALNRNTIEVFDNVGGDLFPFQRIEGAQIEKGATGTHACCIFMETCAFLGSGWNEAPGIYLGVNANAEKISTQEIDEILLEYTEAELATVNMEMRNDRGHQHLYVHLPDRTIVFDGTATEQFKQPVWFTLTSSLVGFSKYRAQNFVWCYDKWLCGDPANTNVGYLVQDVSTHYGSNVRWEFGTTIVYNEGRGAIFQNLELVALTGAPGSSGQAFAQDLLLQEDGFFLLTENGDKIAIDFVTATVNPTITTSYSVDGQTWSQPKTISAGAVGNRAKRLVWFQQGWMRNWRIQRFQGTSESQLSFMRLEAALEPLAF